MKTPSEYVEHLVSNLIKQSLIDFFDELHTRYYPNYDIKFKKFFMKIIEKDGEFCVKHIKLVKYGVLSSGESSVVRRKLERHNMIEGKDFRIETCIEKHNTKKNENRLLDARVEQTNNYAKPKKIYYLTPDSFKKCLMNTQKHPSQTVNPEIYSDYFLLLEKVHKYFSDYEKQYLLKLHVIKDDKIDELSNNVKILLTKNEEQSIENKIIRKQNEEQSIKIDELLDTTRSIFNQNVDLKENLIKIENELITISSKMDILLNLYINDGNGYMIFQKIINDHDGNFSTNITLSEQRHCPGLSRLKCLFLFAFYKDGEIHIYSIARNLSYSLDERLNELMKRYPGWKKLLPYCVSLIYTEINIELTFLESNSFWETGSYDRNKKCYVINYDMTMTRNDINRLIKDGFARARNSKINNYQKNIYEYNIDNNHDEIIIGTLINKDNVFHDESRDLLTKITKSICLKKTEKIIREDIEYNDRVGIKMSDKYYYMAKLYQFIKSQNSLELIEEFKNNT
jgi:hypothetical protein